ncbi:MAG TPA: hypothetical protein VKR58_10100 [Aquella sp.]|nr:hypothetical protein [Aquella sp.]
MNYRPSLSDISQNNPAPINTYRPSLSDLNDNDNSFNRMENLNPQSSVMHSMPNRPMTITDVRNALLRGSGALLTASNPELMPEIGMMPKFINALGRIGSGTTGATLMNAPNANSIQELGKNAGQNAALNTGLEAISPALNLVGKGLSLMQPQKYAQQFIDKLSGGQNLENTGKYIASNINNAYKKVKDEFKNKYDNLFNSYDSVGDSRLYNRTDPIIGIHKPTPFENLNLTKDDIKDSKLFDSYSDFLSNPTLEKAHDLQSDFGKRASLLKSNQINPDHDTIQTLMNSRKLLQNDIHNFMESYDKGLSNDYKKLGQDYKKEVVPYYSDTNLNAMAEGKTQNPTRESLIRLFRNPDTDINTIIGHQTPDFKNKILHVLLGQEKETVTPQSLLTAIKPFGKKGLNSYRTPELNDAINSISNRQALQNVIKRGAGAGAGYLLGHLSGNPSIEALGALGGFTGAPNAMHLLKYPFDKLHLPEVTQPLKNALIGGYKPALRFLGNNSLSNQ